jgi:hypothetical protein
VILGVGAIAVAATVDAVRGGAEATPEPVQTQERDDDDSGGDEALVGPDSPLPGALPGRLVLTTADGCRLQIVDLASLSIGELGPSTTCAVWAAPSGDRAAVVGAHSLADPEEGRFALVRLTDPPELTRRLGELEGEPSWSPDGTRLAWCTPAGETVVLTVPDGAEQRTAGCGPRFTPGGSLLTSSANELNGSLLRDGEIELAASDLLRGWDDGGAVSDIDVLAYDESPDGLLAVTVLKLDALGSVAVLELWQNGDLVGAADLPSNSGNGQFRFGEYVRFSPNATGLAVGATPRGGRMAFFDLRVRQPTLDIESQRAFAWSPDGAWLAAALDDEIAFYSTNGTDPVYRLPLDASSLAWVSGAGPDAAQEEDGEG